VKTVTIGPFDNTRDGIQQYNILHFYQDGSERPRPLQEEFEDNFQKSLFSIVIISVCASFLIGLLITHIFTRPLRSLGSGMRKLRSNDYKQKLRDIGIEEFDDVICEFNRLTDELDRVEGLRKDLISDTSHELKTPLTSLRGQLEGVRDGVFEMDEPRVKKLIDQVSRISELVDRLQEFSRIQSKTVSLQKKRISLQSVVNDVVEDLKEDVSNKGMKIHFSMQNNEVNADRDMLMQVIRNLIQNAISYSHAKNIEVGSDETSFWVKDDGIGIPKAHQKYIFERFYRVEKSRNRATGGLGLGLAIVKEIVDAHGWKISVEGVKPKGVSFTIRFSSE
jgi:signal transduction histidine kinase